MLKRRILTLHKLTSLVLILLVCYSCAVNPVTGKKEFMLMSREQEKALGLQSDPSIIASYGLYPDEKIQSFIQEKGAQMGKISHLPDLEYQFRVLDSPVVNAFAVPGGYVYFTRGILAHFNNEAEFAGVLGHEIGHVTARHSASQYSKSVLAQVGLAAGMILSPEFRQFGDAAQQGVGLLFLKFGRDDESQSDRLGVEYSTKIGYDAHEMADFFQTLKRLSDKSGQRIPTFMSTHPDPGDRYNKVHQEADKWQSSGNVDKRNLTVNRNSYLRMIDGLVYGENPRQGFFENNIFYHPDLKFQFPVPSAWKTVNSPQAVQLAPADGKAMVIFTLAQHKTLDEAARATLEEYKLQTVDSGKRTIGGLPTMTVIADLIPQQQAGQQQQQQQQQILRIRSHFIKYGDYIYRFMGVAERNSFNTYDRYFARTAEGFKNLNDPDKLNRQPERVRVKTVNRTAPLSTALRSLGTPTTRLEELAILNGMNLNDQVTQGTLLKVIGK